jgi:hypothetical protein
MDAATGSLLARLVAAESKQLVVADSTRATGAAATASEQRAVTTKRQLEAALREVETLAAQK